MIKYKMDNIRTGIMIASLLGHTSNEFQNIYSKHMNKDKSKIMTSGEDYDGMKKMKPEDNPLLKRNRMGNLGYAAGGIGPSSGQTTFPDDVKTKYEESTDLEVVVKNSPYSPNDEKIYQKFKPDKRPSYGKTRNYENEVKLANANYIKEINKYNTVF